MSVLDPREAQWRAAEAKRLLDEPLLIAAFAELEKRAYEELLRVPAWSPLHDRKRRMLVDRINGIRELRGQLQSVITMGKQEARGPIGIA